MNRLKVTVKAARVIVLFALLVIVIALPPKWVVGLILLAASIAILFVGYHASVYLQSGDHDL